MSASFTQLPKPWRNGGSTYSVPLSASIPTIKASKASWLKPYKLRNNKNGSLNWLGITMRSITNLANKMLSLTPYPKLMSAHLMDYVPRYYPSLSPYYKNWNLEASGRLAYAALFHFKERAPIFQRPSFYSHWIWPYIRTATGIPYFSVRRSFRDSSYSSAPFFILLLAGNA